MTLDDALAGPLNAYRLASAVQDGVWSPIEDMRRQQARQEAADEIARLLLARLDAQVLAEA